MEFVQPNLHWTPDASSYPGSYHLWTWEYDDDDDDAGELLVQQATLPPNCVTLLEADKWVGSPPLFYWISTTNKEVGFFFSSTKPKIRALKKKDQGATSNKAPIWRVSSTDKLSMRDNSPWIIVYLYFYRWPVLCPNLDYSIIALKDSGTYIWHIIKLSLKSGD